LEILKGYVPGYDQILGHEFVGIVKICTANPVLEGRRVVGEINCPCSTAEMHPDPIFQRNHSPGRTVLGIIGKDVGALHCASCRFFACSFWHCMPGELKNIFDGRGS